MTDQMNLLITDRETGEKYTDSQSNLREIWEDHYRVIDKGEEEPDIYIPEEYQADGFGLVFQDGTVEIYGWTSDGTACEPMPLNPERFSISIPGQISEEKVRRAFDFITGYTREFEDELTFQRIKVHIDTAQNALHPNEATKEI